METRRFVDAGRGDDFTVVIIGRGAATIVPSCDARDKSLFEFVQLCMSCRYVVRTGHKTPNAICVTVYARIRTSVNVSACMWNKKG